MNPDLMYKLKRGFQKKIFNELINLFGSSLKASKALKIPASSIRGYKNLYFDAIPESVLNKILDLRITNKEELKKKTIMRIRKKEIVYKCLEKGRKQIQNKFLKIQSNIPTIKKIIHDNYIDVFGWLKVYHNLINVGFRKSKIEYFKEYALVSYTNFNGHEFKKFKVKIPKKFYLSEKFLYFFGLWCGDRAGGKRFGICNKNENILNFTEKFLKQSYQKVEKILYMSKSIEEPKVEYDKKVVINHNVKGWALTFHAYNGILASFFHYLQDNLDYILKYSKNNAPFFAGLFDAEGNVSIYNKSFRWACKNERLIDIYSRYLKKLKLFDRYDGGCLVSYNKEKFRKFILPYLKHKEKISLATFMLNGFPIPKNYILILEYLKDNPRSLAKDIAKALKINKVYSELGILGNFGFIEYQDYPYKFKITNKGLKSLGD